jgi:hypothetical protein
MTNTEQCRIKAAWRQIGKGVYKLPKFVYRVPVTPKTRMVEHLGAVKERADGRWDWWRFRSKWHKNWQGEGQGVALSLGAAEMRVLEGGWEVLDELQAIREFQEDRTLTPEQGCTLTQILKGGPWPTYILEWGKNMPKHILEALKQEGEAALILNKKGEVHSMIVYNELVGMREMSVTTMREQNRRMRCSD